MVNLSKAPVKSCSSLSPVRVPHFLTRASKYLWGLGPWFRAVAGASLFSFLGLFLALHIHHVTQHFTVTSGTVLSTSSEVIQVQCGSVQSGNVAIPIFCPETVYHTVMRVADSSDRFAADLDDDSNVGTVYTAYKTGAHSYTVNDPKGGEQLFEDLAWSLFLAVGVAALGMLLFMVHDLRS